MLQALEAVDLLDRWRRSCQVGSSNVWQMHGRWLRPPIILADEPTGALDSKTGAEIMDIIRRLNEQRLTIIVITNDQQVTEKAK
ncbi:hypothetical protein [Paenibacillus qinlingensis]|uniref:hypothetical protein n=1 Tax=Paenibacillus qinlingensis TaxID=1837343 RepID=UPI001564A5AE|nr:hypothetical protein [Paenibacillus qinlingensis]NQX59940.1 hypothetical protein [Paenibacillus qinlingensis]